MPDYYALLGVLPSASQSRIQQAYRAQARQHHPDRGGAHARMVQLNEAYFVLSDPQRRAEYDRRRAGADAQPSARSADWEQSTTAQEAKTEAQDYPQDWEAFEQWLSRIAADFTEARYGSRQSKLGQFFDVPVVEGSFTGRLFVGLGGLIGGAIAAVLCVGILALAVRWIDWPMPGLGSIGVKVGMFLFGGAMAAGAWIGCELHRSLRSRLLQSWQVGSDQTEPGQPSAEPSAEAPTMSRRVVCCPQCSQKLRVPVVDQALTVACPSCRHRFVAHPVASAAGV